MAEEYFVLGWDLQESGTFGFKNKPPYVLRPPGYPFFIALVLEITGGVRQDGAVFKSQAEMENRLRAAFRKIYLAQCFLHSLSTLIFFLWMSRFLSIRNAFILSFLYGSNPYMVMLTGTLHYEILHVFLTILSSYSLYCCLESDKSNSVKMLLPGILWGLTTLTRPTTLILPVFVGAILCVKYKMAWRPILKTALAFIIGMALVITPYTWRNYVLTGKIIPVNAQGGIALWAATVHKTEAFPNHYKWWNLWERDGKPIYFKTVQSDDPALYFSHALILDEVFKKEAGANFRRQPGVFFYNFFVNSWTFNIDINSVLIKFFQVAQTPGEKIYKMWLTVGNPQNFYSSRDENIFKIMIYLLTILSFLGVGIAIRNTSFAKAKIAQRRIGSPLLVPFCIYLCFCIAHGITYMDFMYYYIKVPFLYIFSGYFINQLEALPVRTPFSGKRFSAAHLLNGLLTIIGVSLTVSVIL